MMIEGGEDEQIHIHLSPDLIPGNLQLRNQLLHAKRRRIEGADGHLHVTPVHLHFCIFEIAMQLTHSKITPHQSSLYPVTQTVACGAAWT
jgi:hypothetical protein